MSFSPVEVSAAEMKAAFPIIALDIINGRPNLYELMRLLKQICRCSQTTKSCLGPLGYLFVALPLVHYQRFTSVPLNLPGPTPNIPNFNNQNSGEREQTKINWTAHKAENNNISNMNETLCTFFLAAIEPAYKKHLENDMIGRATLPFWTVFETFLQKYGRITPMDLENNLQRMKKEWDPTTPIEDLFGQINDANEYSIFSEHPYTNAALVNAGEIVVLRTGQFATQYGEWRKNPPAQRTWTSFVDFWQSAYDLKQETEATAGSMGYGNKATVENEDDTAYEETVRDFGTAFAANSTAFQNLSEANQQMGENVADNLTDLQNQVFHLTAMMQNMANAPAAAPPPQQYGSNLAAPPAAQPPATPSYMGTPYAAPGRGRGFGGNFGGRGGNNRYGGRGDAYNRQPAPGRRAPGRASRNQRPYWMQNEGDGYTYPPRGTPAGNAEQFSNTVKRYANWNYCWSCGHDIKDWHNSTCCPVPRRNHVWTATKQYTCGGSNKNAHKVTLPPTRSPQQQPPYY